VPIQGARFDKPQRTLDSGPCPFPCRAEWSCFGAASQTRAITGTFGRRRAPIKLDVSREWGPHPADRTTVDTGRLDGDKDDSVECGVASLKGFVLSDKVQHVAAIFRMLREDARLP
jgi:hypothetical protein